MAGAQDREDAIHTLQAGRKGMSSNEGRAQAKPTLGEIEGLDVEGAVKRFMGNRVLYENLVRKFVNGDMATAAATVKTQLDASDLEAARRTAHTLKGVAGTLGATALQTRAERLEHSIRDGESADAIEMARLSTQDELNRLLLAMRSVIGEDPKNGGLQ